MKAQCSWCSNTRYLLLLALVAGSLIVLSLYRSEVIYDNSVSCDGSIDRIDQLPKDYSQVLGVVAFPMVPVETGGRVGPKDSYYYGFSFAKFGLLTRLDSAISLTAPTSGDVLFDWALNESGRPANSLQIGPCEIDGAGWVVFAGGVWVARPTCATITVTSGEETAQVQIGVDRPCTQR